MKITLKNRIEIELYESPIGGKIILSANYLGSPMKVNGSYSADELIEKLEKLRNFYPEAEFDIDVE